MNPPRDPESDLTVAARNAGAICDRLDILVEAQARTNQVLADLVLALNAVLVMSAKWTPGAQASNQAIMYARQCRDLAAALDPDDARREAGRQGDFSAGHPWGRS